MSSSLSSVVISNETFFLSKFTANDVSNYWLLSTDYDHYAIVYYCRNTVDDKSEELAWLLSRDPVLNPAVQEVVDGLIDTHFDRSAMYKAKQDAEHCEPR